MEGKRPVRRCREGGPFLSLLLGQQKKQTTVNAATPQPACGAGALTWGPDQGMEQRFPEQEEGLEEPVGKRRGEQR